MDIVGGHFRAQTSIVYALVAPVEGAEGEFGLLRLSWVFVFFDKFSSYRSRGVDGSVSEEDDVVASTTATTAPAMTNEPNTRHNIFSALHLFDIWNTFILEDNNKQTTAMWNINKSPRTKLFGG